MGAGGQIVSRQIGEEAADGDGFGFGVGCGFPIIETPVDEGGFGENKPQSLASMDAWGLMGEGPDFDAMGGFVFGVAFFYLGQAIVNDAVFAAAKKHNVFGVGPAERHG